MEKDFIIYKKALVDLMNEGRIDESYFENSMAAAIKFREIVINEGTKRTEVWWSGGTSEEITKAMAEWFGGKTVDEIIKTEDIEAINACLFNLYGETLRNSYEAEAEALWNDEIEKMEKNNIKDNEEENVVEETAEETIDIDTENADIEENIDTETTEENIDTKTTEENIDTETTEEITDIEETKTTEENADIAETKTIEENADMMDMEMNMEMEETAEEGEVEKLETEKKK